MSGATSKRYPVELRERAVRMVAEIRDQHESEWGAGLGAGAGGVGSGAGGGIVGGGAGGGRGMMPMHGNGNGNNDDDERERTTWLNEDDDVWGAEDNLPGVIR